MIDKIALAIFAFGSSMFAAVMITIITDLAAPEKKRRIATGLLVLFLVFEFLALAVLVLSP